MNEFQDKQMFRELIKVKLYPNNFSFIDNHRKQENYQVFVTFNAQIYLFC